MCLRGDLYPNWFGFIKDTYPKHPYLHCVWKQLCGKPAIIPELISVRNARLFIILFVRNFWRVCSQFRLSVRNSVTGPSDRNSRVNPSLCWLGGGA